MLARWVRSQATCAARSVAKNVCICAYVECGWGCSRCGRTTATGSIKGLLAVSRTGVLARTSVSSSRAER